MRWTALASILTSGVLLAQLPKPADVVAAKAVEKVPELPKALDGVWLPTSLESLGAEQLKDDVKEGLRLSIEKGQHKLYFLTDPVKMLGQRVSASNFTVDEKAGTFELEITEGQSKGTKVHGLFEVKGDELKLCYGPADKERPKAFASSKEQPGVFNETWTRYKKK